MDNLTPALEPCPFCGVLPHVYNKHADNGEFSHQEAFCMTSGCLDVAVDLEIWNTRAALGKKGQAPAADDTSGGTCLYTPTDWQQYPRKEWATACGLKVVHDTEAWDGTKLAPVGHGEACMKCKRKPVEAALAEPMGKKGQADGVALGPKESVLALGLCEAVAEYIAADGSITNERMAAAAEAMEKALEEHDIPVSPDPAPTAPEASPAPDLREAVAKQLFDTYESNPDLRWVDLRGADRDKWLDDADQVIGLLVERPDVKATLPYAESQIAFVRERLERGEVIQPEAAKLLSDWLSAALVDRVSNSTLPSGEAAPLMREAVAKILLSFRVEENSLPSSSSYYFPWEHLSEPERDVWRRNADRILALFGSPSSRGEEKGNL